MLSNHHIFLHTIMIILGWSIYFLIIYLAFRGTVQVFSGILMIVFLAFIVLSVTIHSWSRFHKKRHERLGFRRSHVTDATLHYDKDWLGYSIQSDVDAIKNAKLITIDVHTPKRGKKVKEGLQDKLEKIYKIEEVL